MIIIYDYSHEIKIFLKWNYPNSSEPKSCFLLHHVMSIVHDASIKGVYWHHLTGWGFISDLD